MEVDKLPDSMGPVQTMGRGSRAGEMDPDGQGGGPLLHSGYSTACKRDVIFLKSKNMPYTTVKMAGTGSRTEPVWRTSHVQGRVGWVLSCG